MCNYVCSYKWQTVMMLCWLLQIWNRESEQSGGCFPAGHHWTLPCTNLWGDKNSFQENSGLECWIVLCCVNIRCVCVCVSVRVHVCVDQEGEPGSGWWILLCCTCMYVCVCVYVCGSGRGALAVLTKASCADQAWCAHHNLVHVPVTPACCAGPFSYPSDSFLLSGSLMQFLTSQSDFY